jgi:hypothetical protein
MQDSNFPLEIQSVNERREKSFEEKKPSGCAPSNSHTQKSRNSSMTLMTSLCLPVATRDHLSNEELSK